MNDQLLFIVKTLDDLLKSDCVCRVCLAGILDDFLRKTEQQIDERTLSHPLLAQAH